MNTRISRIIFLFLALAISMNAYGQVSKPGKLDMTPGFSRYAKDYVEERINRWQTKGEFEKTDDYRRRIEMQREKKIKELTEEARENYIRSLQPNNLKSELSLSTYNADAEVYIISHPTYGDFVLPIAMEDAPDLKNYWLQLKPEAVFIIENDHLALESISFKPLKGKTKHTYQGSRINSTEYAETEINFNFDPIEIEVEKTVPVSVNKNMGTMINSKKTPVKSDIDKNIPSGRNTENSNTFAVVIANENYRKVSNVDYAHNDGDITYRYFVETLGIPDSQIHYVKDATLNDMRGEIEWMKEVGQAYNGDASFIFYYAGHGIPDESTSNGYLLPVDGFGAMASSGLALQELNESISSIPSKLSLLILDACFSGAMRDGEMLASARGVALKVRPQSVTQGRVVVLTAAQNDETAAKSDEFGHGLFTYYFLKKIQESNGEVRLGDLAKYTVEQVRKYSVVQNRKPQTPSVLTSPIVKDQWSDVMLSKISK